MTVVSEKEMPIGQRNLVESNFEEGSYERGIYLLNELLMEDVRPPQYAWVSVFHPADAPELPQGSCQTAHLSSVVSAFR